MPWLSGTWSLGPSIAAFVGSAVVIGFFGIRLVRVVDRLADRTGIGAALGGAVLLAGANSLSGLVVSLVAADFAYRQANLEHAAASLTNVFNSLLMVVLLAVVVMGIAAPAWTMFGIHPATPLLLFTYVFGIGLARRVEAVPMWEPRPTAETRVEVPEKAAQAEPLPQLVLRFVALAAIVTVAGWVVGQAGISVMQTTGIGGTAAGTLFTSVATSLPELVTAVAAVRLGALSLAVGGIVGGNAFDMLFIAIADGVYRKGSLYDAATQADVFVLGWTMVLVAIVGAGLVYRQRPGIGFEGISIILIYLAGAATVVSIG